MSTTVECSRCGKTKPGLERPPYPGELGRLLASHACADCWQEWRAMEVMVINELRLNFMDPRSMEVLGQHIRDFFVLPPAAGSEPAAPGPADVGKAADPD